MIIFAILFFFFKRKEKMLLSGLLESKLYKKETKIYILNTC